MLNKIKTLALRVIFGGEGSTTSFLRKGEKNCQFFSPFLKKLVERGYSWLACFKLGLAFFDIGGDALFGVLALEEELLQLALDGQAFGERDF